jgi:hypothetical protein
MTRRFPRRGNISHHLLSLLLSFSPLLLPPPPTHKLRRYVPMKSICERFPDWLATHAASQTKEEYEK